MADEQPKGRDGYIIKVSLFVPVPPRDMKRAVEAGRVLERLRAFQMRPGDEKHFEVLGNEEEFVEGYQGGQT